MSDEKERQVPAPTIQESPVESTSFIVLAGVENSVPQAPGLSFQSITFTVPAAHNDFDGDYSTGPEKSSPGSVSSLRNRLRSGVPDSAFLRDPSGDF
jgi:hypothetical protein